MTEAEANEKWCPFVGDGTISPHVQSGLSEGRCIGSACMAWRWRRRPGVAQMQDRDGIRMDPADPGDGYCGLAGKP